MRSQEQIIADVERRFRELQEQARARAVEPQLVRPCRSCRWFSRICPDGYLWFGKNADRWGACRNPLVAGFAKRGVEARTQPMPCGPEKALWEQKLTPIDKILSALDLTA